MCILKEIITYCSQDYTVNILFNSDTDSQYVSAAFV